MASHKNNSTKGQPEIFIHIERLAFHFIAFKCLLIKMENGNQCQMQRECCSKAFTFTFTLTIAGFLFSLLAKCSMERKAKGKKLIRISIRQLNGIFYLLCHLLKFIWKFKSEIVLISKPIQMCICLNYSQFRGFTCNCNKRAPLAGAPHSKTN